MPFIMDFVAHSQNLQIIQAYKVLHALQMMGVEKSFHKALLSPTYACNHTIQKSIHFGVVTSIFKIA